MRLAVTSWNGTVSPVFDVSQEIQCFEIKEGTITKLETNSVPTLNSFDKVRFLVDHQIDTLICGALTRPVEKMICNQGIELHSFISGTVQTVIKAWQTNDLTPGFKMPGCRRRRYDSNRSSCCQGTGQFNKNKTKRGE